VRAAKMAAATWAYLVLAVRGRWAAIRARTPLTGRGWVGLRVVAHKGPAGARVLEVATRRAVPSPVAGPLAPAEARQAPLPRAERAAVAASPEMAGA